MSDALRVVKIDSEIDQHALDVAVVQAAFQALYVASKGFKRLFSESFALDE